MTTATLAIANHLGIATSLIKEVEEWANVLFVRFVKGSPRFVSKKVVKEEKQMPSLEELEQQWEREENEREAKVQSLREELIHFVDAPLKGSPKQIKWAKSIRSFAIERDFAQGVASGRMTFEEAKAKIENPSARWWIDNRKEWCN